MLRGARGTGSRSEPRKSAGAHAETRAERPPPRARPGNARRPAVPQLLAARAPRRGIARGWRPAGAREAALRAAARIPRQRGTLWPDRRVLRPPRRVALVRA